MNLPRKRGIRLTPRLYRELDIIARTKAGTVVEIVPYDEMEGAFASVSQGCGGNAVIEDVTYDSWMIEKRVIQLSNQVILEKFYSPVNYEIARLAILRADVHGMEQYGPAPTPLEETRDMIQEAIEELLDAIYYQIRQVAKLEDLRIKLASSGGGKG